MSESYLLQPAGGAYEVPEEGMITEVTTDGVTVKLLNPVVIHKGDKLTAIRVQGIGLEEVDCIRIQPLRPSLWRRLWGRRG